MKNILEIAKQRNLIFVDSLTTQHSVVDEVAEDMNVTYFERDIFIDNSKKTRRYRKTIKETWRYCY